MAAWDSGQAVKPACSCSRMTFLVSGGCSASSSSQSATQRIMLAGLPHRVRLSRSGWRSSTYCMASMPPQELPNRCSQPGQAEGRADLGDLLDEALDGPQGQIVRAFGPAAAQLVVEDDL